MFKKAACMILSFVSTYIILFLVVHNLIGISNVFASTRLNTHKSKLSYLPSLPMIATLQTETLFGVEVSNIFLE